MKKHEIPFSHPVAVATLHGVTHLKLTPDAEALRRMARALGLHSIDAARCEFVVTHASNGLVSVEGTLAASVHPLCVITMEPLDETISESIAVRFAPAPLIERMTKRAEENGDLDFEPPDPITDGVIDFGALMTEFIALSLDPYPKKPGAEFKAGDLLEPPASPFDALKALKPKDGA